MIRIPLSVAGVLFAVVSCAKPLRDPTGLERYAVKRNASVAFINPAENGGSMLDSSAGLGEPLNVIVSALSSPEVLTKAGFINWARSVGFTNECFGFHIGNPQTANLGDGRGWVNESAVLRYDFNQAIIGTCLESLAGGNHFRYWTQRSTGAYFLAVSVENWAGEHHSIVPDGYDLGRDSLVIKATGNTKYYDNEYSTTSYYLSGLLQNGTEGINHNIAIDGQIAVLTVTKKGKSNPKSGALRSLSSPGILWCIILCVMTIHAVL